MAEFILNMHQQTTEIVSPVDSEILKKYFSFARQNIKPVLSDVAMEEIKDYYVKMRTSGSSDEGGVKAIPISARQLEALVRLSEASAKARFANIVSREDARRAIDLVHYCLLQIGLDPETGKFDIDRITSGVTSLKEVA
jgi:replicative DNA helicase Mcm